MNERMTPISFESLMRWALSDPNHLFSVPLFRTKDHSFSFLGQCLEIPTGPAAGPHTQLAQNIVAAYAAGARYFELKTVQTLDGEDLPVAKPCILTEDACFNVEWSTELTVSAAFDEYVKAWFALKLLSKELALGRTDGFQFNMSVGYDLSGIQSDKINAFIEGLKNAEDTPIFAECMAYVLKHTHLFQQVDKAYIQRISPCVSNSITLSTLHGCPPEEIERIASYLIKEKRLHTFVKCNPTLLGYDTARGRLDTAGYQALVFDDHHFKNDLQYIDANPMFQRLMALAEKYNVTFGVKLSNTLPVKVTENELPGEEMYLSGPPLYLLTTALCARLAQDFHGKLPISYAGGADALNIQPLFQAGILPITMAATLLKPGGYMRFAQIANELSALPAPSQTIDVQAVARIADEAMQNPRYQNRKSTRQKASHKAPLRSCHTAPCQKACPIGQDIPEYLRLFGDGRALDALRVITERNPLPGITGTLCNHACQGNCRRTFYEESIRIRNIKRFAAKQAIDTLIQEMQPTEKTRAKVAVVGGGPAGLAAAFFLSREGFQVELFEKSGKLGGIVTHIIPRFRIDDETIQKDIELVQKMGGEFHLNHEIKDISPLRAKGFQYIVLAVGASLHGTLFLEAGEAMHANEFLRAYKTSPDAISLGQNVVVIGGGNSAIDAARAAMRIPSVQNVTIVYRRDVTSMPASEEELREALLEGVALSTLRTPLRHENGLLTCKVNVLGMPDSSGRRIPIETDETIELPADTVIAAIGDKVDRTFFESSTFNQNTDNVYWIGDCKVLDANGTTSTGTIVQAIADAQAVADDIFRQEHVKPSSKKPQTFAVKATKGMIMPCHHELEEPSRCLSCDAVCGCCVDVCPNRANISIPFGEANYILHIDRLCNACGNCEAFCPYSSAPYRNQFTLFDSEESFRTSKAPGMVVLDRVSQTLVRAEENVDSLVEKVLQEYPFLL